jgi:hypothetical protein
MVFMSYPFPRKIVNASSLRCTAALEQSILFYSFIRVASTPVTICGLEVKKGREGVVTVFVTTQAKSNGETTSPLLVKSILGYLILNNQHTPDIPHWFGTLPVPAPGGVCYSVA